ncbi:DUF7305 domain-containing protein [Sedimentisphaera salicampi]|uniref:DUF7305 domain-containing protein n=1 Tax=Sedimentisphaera salicampi TaxID=1941349 RepID=UPI000B9BC692|nr:hypothetical protein [Sedimentisphaera salicampi]OXU16142.1 hypothetical protein SMSP1_00082 [Sedimentisphaera salicampi]
MREINKKGSALPTVAVIVMILAMTGLSILKIAQAARMRSARLTAEISAQNAADTGLNMGIDYVYSLWNQNAPDLIDIDYTSPTYNFEGTTADAEYYFTVELSEEFYGYDITSYASAGTQEREVHYRMVIQHPWVGISAKETININVGAGIALLPADYEDFTLVTNLINSNSIVLRNGVHIPGDIIVGPGGDPDSVIDTKREAVIDGETWSMYEEIEYPDVSIPSGLANKTLTIDGSDYVMNESGIYSGISLRNSETLRVEGYVVAVINGDLDLGNGAEIKITSGSSLCLYMAGDIDMGNGSVFSNENFDSASTYEEIRDSVKSVKIYGTPSCEKLVFKNSSYLTAGIYAPQAFIDLRNSSDVYGAVMGKDVILKNSANFYFVFDLYSNRDNLISNLKLHRGSWWES